VRREFEEKNLHEEDSDSDNEVSSIPLDVFRIYYPTEDEIVVDLSTFLYDPISKHITKETSQRILKEEKTDIM